METTTRTVTPRTSAQDFAIGLLRVGPLTCSEALALGGTRLVFALCQLTKHKAARVVYTGGTYRLAVSL